MPLLFSYGTLQHPDLQLTTFGRLLDGFEKPFAYARTAVRLASAKEAWVYVHAPAQIA